MSVSEINELHQRYVRLADRFKTLWTYHQLVSGVYANLLNVALPYQIDFQKAYEPIRQLAEEIRSSAATGAADVMDRVERDLQQITRQLLQADRELSPSIMRRFFERTRAQDEKIIFLLIKFYLISGAVDGERRDKIDFLFTRITQDFIEERGEYTARDSLDLRRQFQSLLAVRPLTFPPPEEAVRIIRQIRDLKDAMEQCRTFDELLDKDIFLQLRSLKHDIGDLYFHPDVLLAIVQANAVAKTCFLRLYGLEESRMIEEAKRLLANEDAITHGLGQSHPDLLDELARFKEFMREFDVSRSESNVKVTVIAQLKRSMNNILAQLDRDLQEPAESSGTIFEEAQRRDLVIRAFGDDPDLHLYLVRIAKALDPFDESSSPTEMRNAPELFDLRLEPWETESWFALRSGEPLERQQQDLALLFLRAAALRSKIDEEARELAAIPTQTTPEPVLLERTRSSLERAKRFDASFRDLLQEGVSFTDGTTLRRLYRSRLRLLRGFSGLWLIYDQIATAPVR